MRAAEIQTNPEATEDGAFYIIKGEKAAVLAAPVKPYSYATNKTAARVKWTTGGCAGRESTVSLREIDRRWREDDDERVRLRDLTDARVDRINRSLAAAGLLSTKVSPRSYGRARPGEYYLILGTSYDDTVTVLEKLGIDAS
jgi:hypothetical protein